MCFLDHSEKKVQQKTQKDHLLVKVLSFVVDGWLKQCQEVQLQPFFNRRNELILEKDIVI